jgi:hypothetical protein
LGIVSLFLLGANSGAQALAMSCQFAGWIRANDLGLPFNVLDYLFHNRPPNETMLFSKEYVGYLARELTKKLIAGEFIETSNVPAVTERVHTAMLEEMSLEDRINDEVRVILEAYSDEMRRSGANYQEMFRKVKSELVRKYKAVL